MKNLIKLLPILLIVTYLSCNREKNYDGISEPEVISKYKNNAFAYGDSLQAINRITKQKLQEFYDIGLLYLKNKNDKQLDSILLESMRDYLLNRDSLEMDNFLIQLKRERISFAKIKSVEKIDNFSPPLDSLGVSAYQVGFYNKEKKFVRNKKKFVKFVLKKNPEKFKNEFKFYFIEFAENDSIFSGVIK